jgi:hypothetical protein
LRLGILANIGTCERYGSGLKILAGEDKFKGELVRGLNALTGHLEYDIGQIKSALSALCALSALVEAVERRKHK